MIKISIALAVFNEEANLSKCLESVKDLAWEIVVVDGGSTDETVEIAKKFRAKIIKTNNPLIFHINKNKAIDACRGDWILQLDADEVVSSNLCQEIKSAVETSVYDGYWIPRKNFFLNKFLTKGGQYPDYTLRLYRCGKGRLPAKDVHEQTSVTGEVGYLKSDLLHLRDKTFSQYLDRFNTYTSLLAYQIKERKIKRDILTFIDYFLVKPISWFVKTFFRHRGYVDGFPGFIFSLFSSIRFPVAYIKFLIDYESSN